MITCAAGKDASWKERWPKRIVVQVIAGGAEWEWFSDWQTLKEHDRGMEFAKFKEFWQDRLMKVLEAQFPGCKGKGKVIKLDTPIDNWTAGGAEGMSIPGIGRGESLGLESSVQRYIGLATTLSPRTEIDGLYITGSDVAFPGVEGAVMGAMMTFFAMKKTAIYEYLLALF